MREIIPFRTETPTSALAFPREMRPLGYILHENGLYSPCSSIFGIIINIEIYSLISHDGANPVAETVSCQAPSSCARPQRDQYICHVVSVYSIARREVKHLNDIHLRQRSNGMTTTAGQERIKQFIATRKKALAEIRSKIEGEAAQITKCDHAILNLERTIPEGRKILQAHEENLTALGGIQQRMNNSPKLDYSVFWDEDTSIVLCNELRDCIIASRDGEIVQKQLEITRKESRILWDKICQLEMELEGWKFSRRLSTAVLEHLDATKASIKKDIIGAQEAFSPLRKVPVDIWSRIFSLVLQMEVADYIEQGDTKSLRPLVHTISHVCHYWHWIVLRQPSIWSLVYAPPVSAWKYDEYYLLLMAIENSRSPVTLLVNIYQAFSQGYNQGSRYDKEGRSVDVFTPKEAEFKGKDYKLHITMQEDYGNSMQRINYLPFRQARSITFSSKSPLRHGALFQYINVPTVQNLTIINDYPASLPNIAISSKFPQLTSLTFRIVQFPSNFALRNYLTTTLKELHIQRTTNGEFTNLENGIQLPQLHSLGIPPSARSLLARVSLPELRTLILYGSNDPHELVGIAMGGGADRVYRRITHLEFREWGAMTEANLNAGAASMLSIVISKMPGLHSIKFVDSWVDGVELADVVVSAMADDGGKKLKYLKGITLSGISGITREECDRIKEVVPRLDIYL